jgi:hypothetical protein
MTLTDAAAASTTTFSVWHIALTAAATGLIALAAATWRLPRNTWTDIGAVAILSTASVLLWRLSANMTPLNADGLHGFSANDWAAPILTYLFLTLYADLRPPADPRRYAQTRALATLASLAINVVTI